MSLRRLLLTAPFWLPAACATASTAPTERMESSSAAILAAENGGAAHSADADVYLKLAKDQFGYAQRLPNPSVVPKRSEGISSPEDAQRTGSWREAWDRIGRSRTTRAARGAPTIAESRS